MILNLNNSIAKFKKGKFKKLSLSNITLRMVLVVSGVIFIINVIVVTKIYLEVHLNLLIIKITLQLENSQWCQQQIAIY